MGLCSNLDYFVGLFTDDGGNYDLVSQKVVSKLSHEDNDKLIWALTGEELKEAFFR